MTDDLKPIYLFADSQLLFHRDKEGLFLANIREQLATDNPKAAYLGASNGDRQEFYELFLAAMHGIGITDCKMISSACSDEERAFLAEADLILLAGGDPKLGWNVFQQKGLDDLLRKRYEQGALLIGVSAGAMQLAKRTWDGEEPTDDNIFPTLKLVPAVISVHDDEHTNWHKLRRLVELSGGTTLGIGIPAGGGIVYHPEYSMEPIRRSAYEIWLHEEEIKESVLLPQCERSIDPNEPELLQPTEIIAPPACH